MLSVPASTLCFMMAWGFGAYGPNIVEQACHASVSRCWQSLPFLMAMHGKLSNLCFISWSFKGRVLTSALLVQLAKRDGKPKNPPLIMTSSEDSHNPFTMLIYGKKFRQSLM